MKKILQYTIVLACVILSTAKLHAQASCNGVSLSSTDASCANISDGTVTLDYTGDGLVIPAQGNNYSLTFFPENVNNPTEDKTYLFSTKTFTTPAELSAGDYLVLFRYRNPTGTNIITCITFITINGPPFVELTTSTVDETCEGLADGSATVSATGGVPGYTYLWSNGSTSTTANGLVTGEYVIEVTDNSGCQYYDTVNVGNGNDLRPSFTFSDACLGQNITFTSTSTGGDGSTLYQWNFGTGASPLTANGQGPHTISYASSGTKSVTLTMDDGVCTSDTTINVNVNEPPLVTATTDQATLCEGESAQLNATGGVTYSWSPATGLSDPNIANPVATPTNNTNYTVTVTDANGCIGTASVNINVQPLPTVTVSGSTAICIGGSTNLSASGGTTYTWSPATSLSNPNIANPIASPTTTTTYTLTVGNAAGCTATTDVTVTVNPLPVITVSDDTTMCLGESYVLEANGGDTYVWSPATGLSDPNSATPTATPTSTTSYTVTGTDINGCSNTASVNVSISPLPTITASPDIAICEGASTNLTASGGISYVWSPATGLSNANISNPTASPTTTTTYTVTGTNTGGCSDDATVTVTVNPLPTITISPEQTICANGSVQLNADGGVSYVWSPSTGLSNPNIANPTASPTATTTYTVTVTSAEGCTGTENVTVNVNPIPTITTNGNQTICTGNSVNLSASGAVSYVWSPATGLSDPNIANPIASPTTTTTYTVTGTSGANCTNTASLTVTVNPLPTVTVSPNATICNGQSTNLTASGGVSYVWSPAAGLSNPNIANPTASPTATTTYTVTVTDANGCINTGTTTITVNPLPVVTVSPNTDICQGQSTALTATGGGTYVWSPATGLSNTTSANPTASPTTTTTYTVTVTDNGCSASESVTVTVNPVPVVTVSSDATICNGESTNLSASGATSYSWSPATGLSNPNIANPVASPTTTTTYTVTGSNASGCFDQETVTVTVNPIPVVTVSPDATICEGESTNLSATGGGTYAWSPATGLSSTSIANPTASPTATTTYTVTVSASGCSASESVTVNVNPIPDVTISGDNIICLGESTTLTASGAPSYSWSPATGLNTTTGDVVIANPTTTTTYTVTSTGANGCNASDEFIVTVNPLPTVTVSPNATICNGESTNLTASGGVSYVWSPAAGLSNPNIANPTASPTATTTYTVTVTDANGCINTGTTTITVNPLPVVTVSPNTDICQGQSTALTATGGGTYAWSPATGLSNTTIANPTASPTVTTTYTVTVTDNGCSASESVTVTVNPVPVVTVSSDATICNGESTNLSASGATSYSWSPATGLSDPNIANPVASPTTTTTYTVTGSNASGCFDQETVTVTVNPIPVVTVSPNATICEGESTNLSATGGGTYAWSPATGLSSTTIANPVASPSSTTTYTVTVSASGCSATESVTVNVNPIPDVTITGDNIICLGESTTLTASGAPSYSWSPATGLNTTTGDVVIANPTTTTTYTVTSTGTNGCNASDDFTVTVNPLPTVTVSPNATICNGESTNLTASGGVSYVWSPATGLSNPNIANPTASPTAATTYTVTVTDANGCINTGSTTITVNPIPVVTVSPNAIICNGQSTALTATGGGTYLWSPATGLSSVNIANPIASPTATTTYTVTVTDNGCSASESVTVTVNPIPVVSTNGDQAICEGESVQLEANGAMSYSWSPATGLSDPNIANPVASPTTTTTYTVTGSNASGCFDQETVTVTVNPIPVVTVSPDATICEGESTNLSATGGGTYAWSPATGLSNVNIANPTASPTTTTTYTVMVSASGCSASESVTVNVNHIPDVTISGDNIICIGESTTLTASGAPSYSWSPATGLNTTTGDVVIANPTTTTTYTVTSTGANGCNASDEFIVIVNPLPTVTVSPNATICNGESTNLTASGGVSYVWSPAAGLSNPNIANPTASPTATTTYTVTVTDANGCINTGTTTITVNPIPVVTVSSDATICEGQSTNLTATGGGTYAWSPATGLSNTTSANPTASPTTTTTYTVTVTDNGCSASESVTVTVNPIPVVTVSPNATICNGESVQLEANGAMSYSWSPATGLSDPNIANPVASPTTTTTYTVTGSNASGCFDQETVTVTVNPIPVVTVSPNATICEGESTNLSATGGGTYAWSPAIGLSSTSIANPTASPTTTITYTVTVSASGCSASESVTVNVNPIPDVTISGDNIICIGESTTLTASGAPSYSWSPATGLNTTTGDVVIANPTTTTTYTVTSTGANGCNASDEFIVTVNPLPVVNMTPATTICQFDTISLDAGGNGVTYNWTPSVGLSSTTINNPLAFPLVNTTYDVVVTDVNGCSNTGSTTISISPIVDLAVSGNDTLCLGQSVTIEATSSNATSFIWSAIPAGAIIGSPNSASTSVTPNITTDFVVTAENAIGCRNYDTVSVFVKQPIPLTFNSPSLDICVGESTTIEAIGQPGDVYTWSPASGLNTTNGSTVTSTPAETITYLVTTSDAFGCTNSGEVTVTVNELPVIALADTTKICTNSSVSLDAGSDGTSYEWSPSTGLSNTNTSVVEASPNVTTTYKVVVTTANGCIDSTTTTVDIEPLISITTSGDQTICENTSTSISATADAASFTWTSIPASAVISSPNDATTDVTPTENTRFIIEVESLLGCVNSDTLEVNVTIAPSLTISGESTICEGDSVLLIVEGGNNYEWSPANGLSSTTNDSTYASPTTTTTYTVISSNGPDCASTATVTVNVDPIPTPALSVNTNTICSGDSVIATATGGLNYSWEPMSNVAVIDNSSAYLIPTSDTKFTLIAFNSLGCFDTVSVNITVNELPIVSINSSATSICRGDELTLNADAPSAVTYNWQGEGVVSPTTNTTIVTPINSGLYTVEVSDANGCENTESITVDVITPAQVSIASNGIICAGDSTLLTASGSVNYSWSPSEFALTPTNASTLVFPTTDLTFTVIGTDANDCKDTASVNVVVRDLPIGTLSTPKDTACFGEEVTLTASLDPAFTPNNSGAYQFNNAGAFSIVNTFTHLGTVVGENTYSVRFRDQFGCISENEVSVSVETLNPISFDIDTIIFPQCTPPPGEFRVHNITGGFGSYFVSLNGATAVETNDITYSNILPGVYQVNISDSKGCSNTTSLDFLGAITFDQQVVSPTCFGDDNGSIALSNIAGGEAPYEFGLNDDVNYTNNSSFTNLTAGLYIVYVRDAGGCVIPLSFELTQPEELLVSLVAQKNISCSYDNDGELIIETSGGNGSHSFDFNGQTYTGTGIFSLENLTPISGTITVTDSLACTATLDYNVTASSPINTYIRQFTEPTSCNTSDASARLDSTTGGSGSYMYSMDGGLTFLDSTNFVPLLLNLNSGIYQVITQDNVSLCLDTARFTIGFIGGIDLDAIRDTVISPNCSGVGGSVSLMNVSGAPKPYLYQLRSMDGSVVVGNQLDSTFSNLESGDYSIIITDNLGCQYRYDITIPEHQNIAITSIFVKHERCGDQDGELRINVTGGSRPYLYSIDDGVTRIEGQSLFTNLSAGTYKVRVFEAVNPECNIGQNASIFTNRVDAVLNIDSVRCFDGEDGKMEIVSLSGADHDLYEYTYRLLGAQDFTDQTVYDNLEAGQYTLEIQQVNKDNGETCTYYDYEHYINYTYNGQFYQGINLSYFEVHQPNTIQAVIRTVESEYETPTGQIIIDTIYGGIRNYYYKLDEATVYSAEIMPSFLAPTTILNVNRGDHVLYIRDMNGCVREFDVNIPIGFYAPNIFTPNGDGKNDTFIFHGLPIGCRLVVYDRWGVLCYRHDGYDNSWDGGRQPDGTYFYELTTPERVVKGWVQIVR